MQGAGHACSLPCNLPSGASVGLPVRSDPHDRPWVPTNSTRPAAAADLERLPGCQGADADTFVSKLGLMSTCSSWFNAAAASNCPADCTVALEAVSALQSTNTLVTWLALLPACSLHNTPLCSGYAGIHACMHPRVCALFVAPTASRPAMCACQIGEECFAAFMAWQYEFLGVPIDTEVAQAYA